VLQTLDVDADDADGELWFQQDCATTQAQQRIGGMFESHVSRTHHFTFLVTPLGQPGLLTSLRRTNFPGDI
jgi:hypothetical protein